VTTVERAAAGADDHHDAEPGGSTPAWGRAALWVRTHPGLVVALLVPVVVFAIPTLFGWTYLNGDNFIQNLPMRVLVGRNLDHGILPLWNPYIFGGTPLLGGFNAGAAYPPTWLTAVLPTFTAWSLMLILAYDVALAGMYAFLRGQGIRTAAATIGAVTFAFAGYMTGQIVHIDLISGAAWLPWTLLALTGLTQAVRSTGPSDRGGRARALRGWAALLAVSIGMSLLAGNAEAAIDGGILTILFWLGRLLTEGLLRRSRRRALRSSLVATATGAAVGIALGAAQWLPGLAFLSHSQRASTTYGYFTSGSLQDRLLALLGSPFVLGTSQGWTRGYVGNYNYPEVTSYVGVLALIAAFSLLLRRWRTRPEARRWWVWYVILVVGALSAVGGGTPFGHFMYLIPGVRSERLLNRNLLLVDFSLAVLLGWWLHLMLGERTEPDLMLGERTEPAREALMVPVPPQTTAQAPARKPAAALVSRRRRQSGGTWTDRITVSRAELIVTCIPLAFMAAVCILLWADGPLVGRWMEAESAYTLLIRVRVGVLITAQVVIAAMATWIVVTRDGRSLRNLTRWLGAVLAVDLLLFNAFVIRPPITEAQAQATGPTSAAFRSIVGNGRFLIYDPDVFSTTELYALGQTDLNIYTGVLSGQGYTALTNGTFYDATGSHYQEDLNPESLKGGVWDDLNATTLLSLPGYFVVPVPSAPGTTSTTHPSIPFPSDVDSYTDSPVAAPTTFALTRGASHTWYFGAVLTASTWTTPLPTGSNSAVRAGLVTPTGGVRWLPAGGLKTTGTGSGRTLRISLAPGTRAAGVVISNSATGTVTVGTPDVTTVEAGEVALDGRMQYGVTSPHWVFTGMLGSFGIFHNQRAAGWARLSAPDGGAPPKGSSVAASAPFGPGTQHVSVTTTGRTVLVRSETWESGWSATVQPVGASAGAAAHVPVTSNGVLQQVTIPEAGTFVVTFTYRPTAAVLGIVVSALATCLLVAWGVFELLARRRRSGETEGPGPPSG